MTVNIGINGFGRIGRLVLRALYEYDHNSDFNVAVINDPSPLETNAHLLKYDSVHGRFNHSVETKDNTLIIDDDSIPFTSTRDPAETIWGEKNVDILLECSGTFRTREAAQKHLDAGAKKILISAPGTDEDITVVYGVNHDQIKPEHTIVSNASCTTNCLAPVAHAINRVVGIKHGFMTTIHSYTGDQRLVDNGHKDLHRARAGALSMIPTSTGAAKAVGKVLPDLAGKLDGTSIRVPTPTVSAVDFKFRPQRNTSVEDINNAIIEAANNDMKGVLGYYDEPLVSCDFIHDPLSSIFALNETKVIEEQFIRILSWYDNEWGFSCRMLDTAKVMSQN